MRRWLAFGTLVLAVAAPAAAAPTTTCPGPGCMPAGSFSVTVPATGKVSFYVVTFKGKATKAPVVSLGLTGRPPTGHVAIAAVEPKAKGSGGVWAVTIFVGISNVKRSVAAATSDVETFTGYTPDAWTQQSPPTATKDPCPKFKGKIGDYGALNLIGWSWDQYWVGDSPRKPQKHEAEFILANQIAAGC